jgi:hypothetical protein
MLAPAFAVFAGRRLGPSNQLSHCRYDRFVISAIRRGARGAERQGTSAWRFTRFRGNLSRVSDWPAREPVGVSDGVGRAGYGRKINHLLAPDGPPSRLREVAVALSVSTFTRLFLEAGNRRCRCGGETVAMTSHLRRGMCGLRLRRTVGGDRGARTAGAHSGLNKSRFGMLIARGLAAQCRGSVAIFGGAWLSGAKELCWYVLAAPPCSSADDT